MTTHHLEMLATVAQTKERPKQHIVFYSVPKNPRVFSGIYVCIYVCHKKLKLTHFSQFGLFGGITKIVSLIVDEILTNPVFRHLGDNRKILTRNMKRYLVETIPGSCSTRARQYMNKDGTNGLPRLLWKLDELYHGAGGLPYPNVEYIDFDGYITDNMEDK